MICTLWRSLLDTGDIYLIYCGDVSIPGHSSRRGRVSQGHYQHWQLFSSEIYENIMCNYKMDAMSRYGFIERGYVNIYEMLWLPPLLMSCLGNPKPVV